MAELHRVVVRGVPAWVDWRRLIGEHDLAPEASGDDVVEVAGELSARAAADVDARLRNLVLGGHALSVEVTPPLSRAVVRNARSEDARRRRTGAPGFSRRGARLDEEGKRFLTPEALALDLGERAAGRVVLDAGCGCGGNSIGFARAGCRVIAVERSRERLAMARHNARIYGVEGRIRFVEGDAVEQACQVEADLLFVDPPWSPDHGTRVSVWSDYPLLEAIRPAFERFDEIWIKLPPSFDAASAPGARPEALFGTGEGDHRRIKLLLLRF